MARKIFYVFLALALFAGGGLLWRWYQTGGLDGQTKQVLGATTSWPAFWQNAELFLVGGAHPRLALLQKDGSVTYAPISETTLIRKAVASPDGRRLIVVTEDGIQQIIWRYEEGKQPVTLAAIRGVVQNIAFAGQSPYLLIQERRAGDTVDRLDLESVDTGLLTQISTDTIASAWIEQPAGALSVDDKGQIWYHALQLSGRTDPPQILTTTVSNVVILPKQPTILSVRLAESGYALSSFELATKAERIITTLGPISAGERALIRLSPSGKKLVVILRESAEQENGKLLLVDLVSGAVEPLSAIARDALWENDNTILFERLSANTAQIWRLPIETKTPLQLLTEVSSAFAS